ncbi:MAG: exosortase A, partial [Pseudomonadota bacterium]
MDGQQGMAPLEARLDPRLDPTMALVIVDRRAASWRAALAMLAFGIAAILVLCRAPALGAVRVWIESATFNHGFLIIPISLYAIWERRARWKNLAPQPAWLALLLLPAFGIAYLVASIASVLEIQQFATVALVEVLILAVLGWRLYWALLFPLLYLFFLVPSGEWLVPGLQDFTANFVVRALELVGVPVYSDGVMISIPEADFRVAEACAGIRFLIASLAFGCLFADLVFVSLWRKAAFILLSLIVPVFANGLRAFGIVMIAHWSNARYAVGVDHIVYGWLFFSLVTFLLMILGWSFRDKDRAARAGSSRPTRRRRSARSRSPGSPRLCWRASVRPTRPISMRCRPRSRLDRVQPPAAPPGWQREAKILDSWHPVYIGADRVIDAVYRSGARRVHLVVAFYTHQRQGAKTVSSGNRIADDEIWQRLSTGSADVTVDGAPLTVPASRLISGGTRQLAWQWYWIGGRMTASPLQAKLMQLTTTLLEGRRSGAAIALAAPYDENPAEATASLSAFLAAGPDIAGMLRRATETGD